MHPQAVQQLVEFLGRRHDDPQSVIDLASEVHRIHHSIVCHHVVDEAIPLVWVATLQPTVDHGFQPPSEGGMIYVCVNPGNYPIAEQSSNPRTRCVRAETHLGSDITV